MYKCQKNFLFRGKELTREGEGERRSAYWCSDVMENPKKGINLFLK